MQLSRKVNIFRILGFLLLGFLLAACSNFPLNHNSGIIKPIEDTKEYSYISLSNGLKVLLISDPDATQAAASMNVAVGSGHDPIQRQGLAHFLEHMLFLGTEKYPTPGDYQKFITSNGGNNNAYTSYEDTNYFFDIDDEHIDEALSRFAQFFVAPTFSEKFLDREKNAVHSEFYLKLEDDSRRIIDAIKSVINPAHPFSKFSTGNLKTLAEREPGGLKKEIRSFYEKYYFAENMSLALYSNKSMSEMVKMVKKEFSIVPAKPRKHLEDNDTPHLTKEILFLEGTLPSKLHIKTLKDISVLSLLFPVEDDRENYKTNSLYFLSHLLGYEGKGSLLSELKRLGWAESLSAGGGVTFNDGTLFPVDISLTKNGYKNIDKVINLFFQTINRIKKEGINKNLYEEQKKISRASFEFRSDVKPINLVASLSNNLRYYQPKDVVFGPYMLGYFDEGLLKKMIESFNPKNVLIQIVSKNEEVDSKTSWYHTPYKIDSVEKLQLNKWLGAGLNEKISVPIKNKYVVEDFSIKQKPLKHEADPEVLMEFDNFKLWKNSDNKFNKPKADFFIRFNSSVAVQNDRNSVLNDLYSLILNDVLNEELYDAYLTGLSLYFKSHLRGLSLNISGFNEKQQALLEEALKDIKLKKVDESRFENIKNEYKLSLENSKLSKPYIRAYDLFQSMMQRPYYSDEQKILLLSSLKAKDLENYASTFWQKTSSQALINGNVSEKQAKVLGYLIHNILPEKSDASEKIGFIKVPQIDLDLKNNQRKDFWYIDTSQNDSAYLRYIQADSKSVKQHALFMMAGQILDPLFYFQMRTEQQLGYLVNASYSTNLNVPGLTFLIQSNRVNTQVLDKAVSLFLLNSDNYINNSLTLAEFEKNKAAILAKLLLPAPSLSVQSAKFWSQISLSQPFDFNHQLAEQIRRLDFDQWKQFFSATISTNTLSRTMKLGTQSSLSTSDVEAQLDWKSQQDVFWLNSQER